MVNIVENPFRWSSIVNLPSEYYSAWKEGIDRLPSVTGHSFDVYEKMDGTNVGLVVWPPHEVGHLLGRNFVIPCHEDTYQNTPLTALRSADALQNGRTFAEKFVRELCGLSDEDVGHVILYGELIIGNDRAEQFKYEDRGVKVGEYFVFGAMLVLRDARLASSTESILRSRWGFATKLKLRDQSAVQVCVNGAFEEWMTSVVPYFQLPRCFARDQSFFAVLDAHAPRLVTDCDTFEGIVLTSGSRDVMQQDRQRQSGEKIQSARDVIYKWKTGLTDDSISEKHLSKLRDEFLRRPKYLEEHRHVYECVCAFMDVFEKNPDVKQRRKNGRLDHSKSRRSPTEKATNLEKFDKYRLELIVNNELTKFDAGFLHDKTVDRVDRMRRASEVVSEAVREYVGTEENNDDANLRKTTRMLADKMVWSLSK
jgi:hypothetical protein